MTSIPTVFRRRALAVAIPGLALFIALGGMSACATSAPPPPAPPALEQPAGVPPSVKPADELRAMVGDAACSDHAQCRTVAWGSKACGGPQSYVAYSTLRTDTSRLEALAKRHAEAQARDNEASGRMSNCALLTDPGAQCMAGRCVLNTVPASR